ncbi:TetR/AcrR family transcriptional regulator [Granulicoccus phenolivorans]|uniref:TetR/AcrR family transcriptional regulator n=1 Tax=Granulicoccus phenolivorans TaxID=266854 RepID=UPI0003F9D215|nr:TetR/AcrR family transcriptional regulator [Granulicoccus phenolivorans]
MTGSDPDDWRHQVPASLSPILSATLEVLVERGFHGASVREIAQRAGLTVPALYYHHHSKEGLLLELLLQIETPIARYAELAAADGADPVERLSHVTECLVLWMTRQASAAVVDTSESRYLGGPARARYAEVRDRIEIAVRGVVADGVAAGDFTVDDVATTVRAILGMLQSIARWYRTTGPQPPEQIAARYVRLVLRMVGVREVAAPG